MITNSGIEKKERISYGEESTSFGRCFRTREKQENEKWKSENSTEEQSGQTEEKYDRKQ